MKEILFGFLGQFKDLGMALLFAAAKIVVFSYMMFTAVILIVMAGIQNTLTYTKAGFDFVCEVSYNASMFLKNHLYNVNDFIKEKLN